MSDSFVEQSRKQQHVLERLIKGLPGIRGYTIGNVLLCRLSGVLVDCR